MFRLQTRAMAPTTAVLRMTDSVHRQILGAVGSKRPEHGMLLGRDESDDVIRHVVFDDQAERSIATYSPDHLRLNRLISEWWRPSGIRFAGFVHSHPGKLAEPSGGDLLYARSILEANPQLDRLAMPIVTPDPKPTLHTFVVVRNGRSVDCLPASLELVSETLNPKPVTSTTAPASPFSRSAREATFRRVVQAYD